MTVDVEMPISSQNWSLITDITFTMEENYFVERIHNQVQHHLTKTMDDTLFKGMIGLSLGTLDIQGFAQVLLICFFIDNHNHNYLRFSKGPGTWKIPPQGV